MKKIINNVILKTIFKENNKGADELIITLFNQKGGTCKTTTAVNLAVNLSLQNYKVLCIDIDPQANATNYLGIDDDDLTDSITNLMNPANNKTIEQVIQKTIYGTDILPADINLAEVEQILVAKVGREKILSKLLSSIKDKYDFIIIDCLPAIGILSFNALTASDYIIIPVEPSAFSLKGIKNLMVAFDIVKEDLNPSINILGVLLSNCELKTTALKDTQRALEDIFSDKLFKTVIRKNNTVDYSQFSKKPLHFFNTECNAYKDLIEFTKEVLDRVKY